MTAPDENRDDVRGADKKEAFHQAAEAKVHTFTFKRPDLESPSGRINCYMAKTDTCSSTILVLQKGYFAPAHYHPNQDGIWLVLKGKVKFYDGGETVTGIFGPLEGICQPENSRYWFEVEGDEEAWLMQIAGFPKGKAAAKRIPLGTMNKQGEGGLKVDMANKPGK
jgi:mannose-6-phosphate isomerase-like protein (cupin superfamily)